MNKTKDERFTVLLNPKLKRHLVKYALLKKKKLPDLIREWLIENSQFGQYNIVLNQFPTKKDQITENELQEAFNRG